MTNIRIVEFAVGLLIGAFGAISGYASWALGSGIFLLVYAGLGWIGQPYGWGRLSQVKWIYVVFQTVVAAGLSAALIAASRSYLFPLTALR
jgi:hypothetical protein